MNNRKIRVVYLISTLTNSGPVNVLYNIIKYLNKDKCNVTIITLSPENPKKSRWKDFENLGINLKSLNLSRLKGYIWGGNKLKKLIIEIEPDIVHTNCFRSNLFSALFLSDYTRCTTTHCDYIVDYMNAYGKIGLIMFLLNHISILKIKNNICCSKRLAYLLNQKYPYLKFNYVNNGVDTEVFHPIEEKSVLREKLKLDKSKKIFIWIGNLIKGKNPDFLVNAILEDKTAENFYIICGEGDLLNKCKEKLFNKTNVLFTGQVNNIVKYLQASDYFVSTSFSEGLPMAVLEAGAVGLPCILSDIPQHRYLFEGCNDIGILFSLNENTSLFNAILKIKQSNWAELSNNILNVVLSNFDAKMMAEQYEGIYMKLMESNLCK